MDRDQLTLKTDNPIFLNASHLILIQFGKKINACCTRTEDFDHQGLPFVFTANTKDAEINFLLSENHTSGLSYAGASDTLSPLLNTPGFVYDYQSYNIPDMVHFSSFLIQTVSKLQHYQLRINNVSEESDILVITSDKSYWASMPVSLSLQSGTL